MGDEPWSWSRSVYSATDAVVAALALTYPDPIVLTSDPDDLHALVSQNSRAVTIARA